MDHAVVFSTAFPVRAVDPFGAAVMTTVRNGRFAITNDFVIHDTRTGIRYQLNGGRQLSAGITAVDGLTLDGKTAAMATLWAETWKPTGLPQEIILDTEKAPKIQVIKGSTLQNPENIFWQWPKDGIATGHEDYVYVPCLAGYGVNPAGKLIELTNKKEIVPDVTDGLVRVRTATGVTITVHVGYLVIYAFGDYTVRNHTNALVFLDNDPKNVARSNLRLDFVYINKDPIATHPIVETTI